MMRFKYIALLLLFSIGSCNYTKKIQTGESAFDLRQYHEAIPFLLDDFNNAQDKAYKAEKAFSLGQTFSKLNQYENAFKWYGEAIKLNYGEAAQMKLGATLRNLEYYNEAIAEYRSIIQKYGDSQEARNAILNCQYAKQKKQDGKSSELVISKSDFNSNHSDYGTALYNNFLVFTSDRPDSEGDELYKWTGSEFSDLFMVSKFGNEVRPFDSDINTADHEGTPCFSQALDQMFFTRCTSIDGDKNCQIYWSLRRSNEWSKPKLTFSSKAGINYGHPTLIENDSVLVFVSNDPEGFGGRDLYYSEFYEDEWSSPALMPKSLNTEGNEMFPVADGDTIYYSSDFLPGLGGLDIFKTYLKPNRQWSLPINVGYPINSGGDDFSLLTDHTTKSGPHIEIEGYFSSSRENKGYDNIYKFSKLKAKKPTVTEEEVIAEVEETKSKFRLFLALKVFKNEYRIPNNPNSGIKEKTALKAAIVNIHKDQKLEDQLKVDEQGRFIIEIEPDHEFDFLVSKRGYLNNKKRLYVPSSRLKSDSTVNLEIVLDKLLRGKEIVLDDIYYDYRKWDIRTDAEPSLLQLAEIMGNNPNLRIQLASHTDCRGEDGYNLDLSQKRAQSAVDFLVASGIENSRLVAKGFGKNRLAIKCTCDNCTEVEHQVNRRTTFKILY